MKVRGQGHSTKVNELYVPRENGDLSDGLLGQTDLVLEGNMDGGV